jgi:hypothetical protein
LPNNNFDVGEGTGPGKYRMNDEAHAKLLDKLAETHFASVTSEVKAELMHFYGESDAPYATKRNRKAWARVQVELRQLLALSLSPAVARSSSDPQGAETKHLLLAIAP